MGTETSKIALNAHVHLRTVNQQMSRPERHVDDITDMRRSCRIRENTSGRRPLGSSSRLLKVPISKTLRRMGMIVDKSVGPAIFIVVGFVLKYIWSVTVSCNFCAERPESSSYLQ